MEEDSSFNTVPAEQIHGMETKLADLRMLMDISAIISSTLDLNELIGLVMEKAKEVMRVEACSILLYNNKSGLLEFEVALGKEDKDGDILKKNVTLRPGEGIAGWVAENRKPLLIRNAGEDSRFSGRADRLTGFNTQGIIAVPIIGRGGLLGVAEILNPIGRSSFSEYDLEIFQALCRQVAVALENAVFHKESIEREKLNQELELAATIQKSFLPDKPVWITGGLSLSGVTFAARQVSGDLYDFVEPVPGKAGLFIGDISGKGVSAALFMAKVISEFRYLMHGIDDPGVLLGRLNRQLADTPRGMFVTGVYAIADLQTGKVRLSTAGHPPLIRLCSTGLTIMDIEGGPPLGIMETEFPVTEITLDPGDRLIMLTDGAFDAKNDKGLRIGYDAIAEFAGRHRHEGRLPAMIVEYVNAYIGGAERADDVTVVELRRIA